MVEFMQMADCLLLLAACVCVVIVLEEDPYYCPTLRRIPLIGLGIGLFAHPMWLLGTWVPGAAGYPWPRLLIDLCMFGLCAMRAYSAISEKRNTVRRLQEIETRARLNG